MGLMRDRPRYDTVVHIAALTGRQPSGQPAMTVWSAILAVKRGREPRWSFAAWRVVMAEI